MRMIILISFLLAGCVSSPEKNALLQRQMNSLYYSVTVSPSISADGVKEFNAVGWNKLPEYSTPDMTIKKWHAQLITTALAKQKICMKGYSYKKVNESNGLITQS